MHPDLARFIGCLSREVQGKRVIWWNSTATCEHVLVRGALEECVAKLVFIDALVATNGC